MFALIVAHIIIWEARDIWAVRRIQAVSCITIGTFKIDWIHLMWLHQHCEICGLFYILVPLRWRHNEHDSVSNQQPLNCLLNRLFRRRSKKTPKLRVTGLCAGNSPGTGEFSTQMASNAENVSIWWRHHDILTFIFCSRHWYILRSAQGGKNHDVKLGTS